MMYVPETRRVTAARGGAPATRAPPLTPTLVPESLQRKDKKIVELPIPESGIVQNYNEQLAARKLAFVRTPGYIRRPARPPFFEADDYAEYDLEAEDFVWLRGHARWGEGADPSCRLPLAALEWFISLMERISGCRGQGEGDRVPKSEMEKLLVEAVSSEAYRAKCGLPDGLNPMPTSGSSFRACFSDVYDYWLGKRKKQGGKPLVRRFWTVTNPSDNNPHHTFRPHEKTIKVRRTRRNDADAVRKLSSLTSDLKQAVRVLGWVKEREALKKAFFEVRRAPALAHAPAACTA